MWILLKFSATQASDCCRVADDCVNLKLRVCLSYYTELRPLNLNDCFLWAPVYMYTAVIRTRDFAVFLDYTGELSGYWLNFYMVRETQKIYNLHNFKTALNTQCSIYSCTVNPNYSHGSVLWEIHVWSYSTLPSVKIYFFLEMVILLKLAPFTDDELTVLHWQIGEKLSKETSENCL